MYNWSRSDIIIFTFSCFDTTKEYNNNGIVELHAHIISGADPGRGLTYGSDLWDGDAVQAGTRGLGECPRPPVKLLKMDAEILAHTVFPRLISQWYY